MKNICPVCYYHGLTDAPYNTFGIGSDEICVCCGFQFGCDDFPDKEEAFVNWRTEWIERGCKWFSNSTQPPSNWDAAKQLQR